ncbi:hypothetical protein ACFVKB_38900 [Rhodococcus sp. NPDC127530]|uniref:hypothetical protein n=1 Tax=unclassified Rhodococcus (in: high G+C Gram-positive bacteria) TaxID=192944 RepID=UPI00362DA0CB
MKGGRSHRVWLLVGAQRGKGAHSGAIGRLDSPVRQIRDGRGHREGLIGQQPLQGDCGQEGKQLLILLLVIPKGSRLAGELSAAPGAGGKPIHEWLELRPFLGGCHDRDGMMHGG